MTTSPPRTNSHMSAIRSLRSVASSRSIASCPSRWPRSWRRCSPKWSSPRATNPMRSQCLTAKKNLRVLTAQAPNPGRSRRPLHRRRLPGADRRSRHHRPSIAWKVVTDRALLRCEWLDLVARVASRGRACSSNCIVMVKGRPSGRHRCRAAKPPRRGSHRGRKVGADGRRWSVRERRVLPLPRRPRRRRRSRLHRGDPAGRISPRPRGHRRRKRVRHGDGFHQRTPLQTLSLWSRTSEEVRSCSRRLAARVLTDALVANFRGSLLVFAAPGGAGAH